MAGGAESIQSRFLSFPEVGADHTEAVSKVHMQNHVNRLVLSRSKRDDTRSKEISVDLHLRANRDA